MSLHPKKKRTTKRGNIRRRKMTSPDSDSTIAGKTRSEILSMNRNKRYRWNKTILPEEKEEVLKIVKIERYAKISGEHHPMKRAENRAKMKGENNPMRQSEVRAKHKIAVNRPEYKAKRSGENSPSKRPEVRTKISKTHIELWKDPEFRDERSGENNPMYGKTHSEETIAKQKAWWTVKRRDERRVEQTERTKDPEFKDNQSRIMVERWKDLEYRAKRIEDMTGESSPTWKGGVSFEPYCPAFNKERKEYIRNLYDRTCTICGKSAIQNRQRLSIDHIDENKMQGCDDWEWRLAPLCSTCHGKMNKQESHLLLHLLLLKNKRGEIAFVEMEEQ